jgi:hypothetical protein
MTENEPENDSAAPAVCGAQLRNRPGVYCRQRPIKGRRRCRLHGGKSVPPGPGHHLYKHGRDSKWTQALGKYGSLYEQARDSEDLLDLRRQIAVMDVAVQKYAARVESLDTPDFRKRALDLYRASRDAEDQVEAQRLLKQLGQLLGQGASEDLQFEALVKTAERMSKRIEAAYNIRLRGAEAVNRAQLSAVLGGLIAIIAEETDSGVGRRIIERADSELFAGAGPEAAPREDGDEGRAVAD